MASDPGQDWWSLVFLFATGMVSVAVEMIRRKAENIDDEDDWNRRERRHTHCRCNDDHNHYHRRCIDPAEDDDDQGEEPS